VNGTTDMVDNTWHHFIVTYDGSSTLAGLKLYVDGTEERDTTGSTVTTMTNSMLGENNEFCLGAREAGNQPFTGMLDECAVWSRELTAAEVTTLYNSGAGLTYPFTATGIISPFPSFRQI